ncbi:MAG: 2-amino-4-hydroxy-6-hydroxymethyldihydropteridine diphosphokinase [Thermodesulfovibrio sp.]|nr:2-amino-4-hydroxy-6-hydroxymethyldihydropteridine diphosphokinase [Thermodesulfovibrio sp.]
MAVVYIGLGSNLGDREKNCLEALRLLGDGGVAVIRQSSLIETEPWGLADQPRFINMAAEVETGLLPHQLLELLNRIEGTMGRNRTIKWGPRVIDLDILLYNDLILNTEDLTVPHPLLHERDFVLRPLSEIAPDMVHPVLKMSIRRLREDLAVKNQL